MKKIILILLILVSCTACDTQQERSRSIEVVYLEDGTKCAVAEIKGYQLAGVGISCNWK